MLKPDDLMRLTGIVRDGVLWAIPFDDHSRAWPVTGRYGLDEFEHLRNSSLLMFQTLTNVQNGLEEITTFLESIGWDLAVDNVLRLQAAVSVTRKCAVEGAEAIVLRRG